MMQNLIIVPCEHKGKKPIIKAWNKLTNNEHLSKYNLKHINSAILTGTEGGVIGLDFDNQHGILWQQILSILPKGNHPKKYRANSENFTLFFKYTGVERNKIFKKDGKVIMEVLSTGRKCLVAPSIHPTDVPYLQDTPIEQENLVALNWDSFISKMNTIFDIKPYVPKQYIYDGETSDDEIIKAIDFIPNHERDVWVQVGRSLYTHNPNMYSIFEKWSSSYSKFNIKECQTVWKSFSNSTSTTIATLFYFAMQYGYTKPKKIVDTETIDLYCPMLDDIKKGDTLVKSLPLPPQSFLRELTDWITETALYPQPILALSSAIAFLGTLKAHKYKTETDLRTNIYMISVAESGTGKDHPRKCIQKLAKSANCTDLLGGKPASGAALIDSLHDTMGKQLLQLDEFGMFLATLTNSNASAFSREIVTNMMELYSSASSYFQGKSYARQSGKKIEARNIDEPCLSVVGSTTPSELYDSLGSKDAVNGFLNRWLIFESKDINPKLNKNGGVQEPPKEMVKQIKNLNQVFKKPRIITISQEADTILDTLYEKTNNNRLEEIKAKSDLASVWVRTRENAIKLALIAEDGIEIKKETMQWACDVSYFCSQQMMDIVNDNIADSQYEKEYKSVLKFIRERKVIKHSALLKRFSRKLKALDLKNIIAMMVECQDIKICNKDKEELKSGETIYYCLT